MQILFLGTGAADWPNPGPKVGKGRRFSSLLLNQTILIDCGPMALDAIREFDVNVNLITDIVIGHGHGDHINMPVILEIAKLRQGGLPPLRLHVNKGTAAIRCKVPPECATLLEVLPFMPGDTFTCSENTVFKAYPASHPVSKDELTTHFIISLPEGKTMYYGLDGSWFPPTTWHAIQKAKFDVIVWELTCGNLDDWRLGEHSNFSMLKIWKNAFTNDGAISPNTKIFCSHMARTLCPPHDLYAREIANFGFTLAYDGLLWESK